MRSRPASPPKPRRSFRSSKEPQVVHGATSNQSVSQIRNSAYRDAAGARIRTEHSRPQVVMVERAGKSIFALFVTKKVSPKVSPSPEMTQGRVGGLVLSLFATISCIQVGMAGFEPTTSTSRTKLGNSKPLEIQRVSALNKPKNTPSCKDSVNNSVNCCDL